MAESEQVTFLTWPSAPAGAKIQLPSEVSREIARRVSEAANALPKRGLEVGGLLLGKKTPDGVEVESLIPLRSGYPEGPAFRLTEAEAKEALESAAARGEVVGIYRSRTDGALDLDHQDELLLRLLGGANIPVLLMRQRKDVPGEGRLVLWGGEGGANTIGPAFPLKDWLEGTWVPKEPVPASPLSPASRLSGLRIAPIAAGLAAIALLVPFLFWQFQVPKAKPVAKESREPRLVVESIPSSQSPPSVAPPAAPVPEQAAPAPVVEPITRSRAVEPVVDRSVALKPFQPPPPRTEETSQRLELPRIANGSVQVAALDLRQVQTPLPPPAPSRAPAPPVVFTQPVLANQPRPVALPPDLRRLLQNEVVLSLRIAVDAHGRVSDVYPTEQVSRAERALWSFYADAVRSWTFEPARRNNIPVPGETILRFRVTPGLSR